MIIKNGKYPGIGYDTDTGAFINLRFNRISSTDHNRGYITVSVGRRKHLAHRLAYEFVYGEFKGEIDHIDNDKRNNRIENLRLVTRSQNQQNMPMKSNNKSGVKGVSWCKPMNCWRARVTVGGVVYLAGYFHDIEKARLAIVEMRNLVCGNYTNHVSV